MVTVSGGRGGMRAAEKRTVKLLQHSLYSARTAAAGHGDLELVVVLRHGVGCGLDAEVRQSGLAG